MKLMHSRLEQRQGPAETQNACDPIISITPRKMVKKPIISQVRGMKDTWGETERSWFTIRWEEEASCDMAFLKIILGIRTKYILKYVVFSFYSITLLLQKDSFYPLTLSSDWHCLWMIRYIKSACSAFADHVQTCIIGGITDKGNTIFR